MANAVQKIGSVKPVGTAPPLRTERPSYKWELLALLWFAFLLNQADRQVFPVVLPLIKKDLGLTDGQLGLIASPLYGRMACSSPWRVSPATAGPANTSLAAACFFGLAPR